MIATHLLRGPVFAPQDLCTRCIRYNQSSGKAWEYLGQILEKSQSYQDAAQKYENAWRHTNEASPSVGYRLAYTYLKAKRLTEAIDVCHKVGELMGGQVFVRCLGRA